MAIDKLILDGDKAIKEQDFLGAISKFNEAIKENPKSFAAHLKRSTAYQKLANYEAASRDISTAFTIAEDKGKRSEIGLCYFRLGLLNYLQKKKKLALMNLNKAKEYDCRESTLDMWKNKVEYDLKKTLKLVMPKTMKFLNWRLTLNLSLNLKIKLIMQLNNNLPLVLM